VCLKQLQNLIINSKAKVGIVVMIDYLRFSQTVIALAIFIMCRTTTNMLLVNHCNHVNSNYFKMFVSH